MRSDKGEPTSEGNAHEKVWETYVRSWRVTTADGKRAIFEASLSPGFVYLDPLARAEGWDQLIAYMLAFHEQVPGGHFVTRRFMAHGGQSVACWETQGSDGALPKDGIGHAEYGADGKLLKLTNFYEMPA